MKTYIYKVDQIYFWSTLYFLPNSTVTRSLLIIATAVQVTCYNLNAKKVCSQHNSPTCLAVYYATNKRVNLFSHLIVSGDTEFRKNAVKLAYQARWCVRTAVRQDTERNEEKITSF